MDMMITDCKYLGDMTIISLNQEPPFSRWKKVVIDGTSYEVMPAYEIPTDLVIKGHVEVKEHEISFI